MKNSIKVLQIAIDKECSLCKNNKLCMELENKKAENERLKECLNEIKEIADIMYNTNCNYIKETEKILKIISEVENE